MPSVAGLLEHRELGARRRGRDAAWTEGTAPGAEEQSGKPPQVPEGREDEVAGPDVA